MKPVADPIFERALAHEIVASERMRIFVLAVTLAILLAVYQLVALSPMGSLIQQFAIRPLPPLLPLMIVGPFILYEIIALRILAYRASRGLDMPVVARFANALIETSLPTVLIAVISHYTGPWVAFSAWPSMIYFFFIVASTLRLGFVLPAFTGLVAASGYLVAAYALVPFGTVAGNPVYIPFYHWSKAAIMIIAGVIAGLVALRLRANYRAAVEAAAERERVTNLFGQHVSPAVVDRLLKAPATLGGEEREICVMFLDMREFTAEARKRPPGEVVDFLNAAFAFMIDAVDKHGGVVNKFLGDGFMAIFGAPLHDPTAARNAVSAARDIIAEIDRRRLADAPWPLRIGIGLHAGPAITGNVGSPRRKEFTAIGDTVNLASRLERLSKEHNARLIVSDAVAAVLDNSLSRESLGEVNVRGYTDPVRVWRLA
jgi:adenylate cyclase